MCTQESGTHWVVERALGPDHIDDVFARSKCIFDRERNKDTILVNNTNPSMNSTTSNDNKSLPKSSSVRNKASRLRAAAAFVSEVAPNVKDKTQPASYINDQPEKRETLERHARGWNRISSEANAYSRHTRTPMNDSSTKNSESNPVMATPSTGDFRYPNSRLSRSASTEAVTGIVECNTRE